MHQIPGLPWAFPDEQGLAPDIDSGGYLTFLAWIDEIQAPPANCDPRVMPRFPVTDPPRQPRPGGRASGQQPQAQPPRSEHELRPPKRHRRSHGCAADCCQACRLRKGCTWTPSPHQTKAKARPQLVSAHPPGPIRSRCLIACHVVYPGRRQAPPSLPGLEPGG